MPSRKQAAHAPPVGVDPTLRRRRDPRLLDPETARQGLRDYALLLFLYNSGARASEAASATIGNLNLSDPASIKIVGKGNKQRICPLSSSTARTLTPLVTGRSTSESVFLNRRNQPITRFGIFALVERYVLQASSRVPSLCKKQVSPHTIRHTTAVHLLRSGVDINTIRAWLGHVSLDTTNIYAEVDFETKAKALASCEILGSASNRKLWHEDLGTMAFLKNIAAQ